MYACVHIPDFEAWVFNRTEGFRGPLVAVASGHVVAANKQARRSGIEPGITEARASVLCPDVAVRLRDYDMEQAVWEDFLLRLHTTSPFLETSPPPFAWLDPGEPGASTTLRALVRGLGVRAGVASTRSFAQLAALRAAPGNTLVLQDKHAATFLDRFEVGLLAALNFPIEMLEQLELLGYRTLQKAATLSQRHLYAQFGADGDHIHALLHPPKEKRIPPFVLPPEIELGYEYDMPCSEPGEIRPVIEHLVDRACEQLALRRTQRVRLSFYCNGEVEPVSRSRVLPAPIGKPKSLLNAFDHLMNALLHAEIEIERVQLNLGSLRNPTPRQHALFQERPSIFTAVRAVNKRFPGMLKRAVIKPGTPFLEEAVSFEPYPDKPSGKSRAA